MLIQLLNRTDSVRFGSKSFRWQLLNRGGVGCSEETFVTRKGLLSRTALTDSSEADEKSRLHPPHTRFLLSNLPEGAFFTP